MSKKANPVYVGAFVLGALALSILVVVLIGSGAFSKPAARYVMFFEGNVGGLRVGAPVTFRGVKVGTVTDIALRVGRDRQTISIPVYVEFQTGQISTESAPASHARDTEQFIEALVADGLRGQLQLQSLVTGQLQVNLDFFPEQPPQLTGLDPHTPELPTVPSPIEAVTRKLEALPLEEIIDQIAHITEGVDRIINSEGTDQALKGLNASVLELQELIKQVSEDVPALLEKVETTAANADRLLNRANESIEQLTPVAIGTMDQLRKTAALEQGRPAQLADALEQLVGTTVGALEESERALRSLRRASEPDSSFRHQVSVLIEELSDASRAVQAAADYLSRHPESLLHGKRKER